MATQERGELRCLVDAGLTPMQALRAGTQWAAQCLALEREVGTLEKGRLADLVVVHGNPLNDITVLLEPAHIGVVLKAVPWPWTGARRRRNDGRPRSRPHNPATFRVTSRISNRPCR
jgi:cytosine/adenosine deaminase-related metal-dependent hydrolase